MVLARNTLLHYFDNVLQYIAYQVVHSMKLSKNPLHYFSFDIK